MHDNVYPHKIWRFYRKKLLKAIVRRCIIYHYLNFIFFSLYVFWTSQPCIYLYTYNTDCSFKHCPDILSRIPNECGAQQICTKIGICQTPDCSTDADCEAKTDHPVKYVS